MLCIVAEKGLGDIRLLLEEASQYNVGEEAEVARIRDHVKKLTPVYCFCKNPDSGIFMINCENVRICPVVSWSKFCAVRRMVPWPLRRNDTESCKVHQMPHLPNLSRDQETASAEGRGVWRQEAQSESNRPGRG